MDDCCAVCAEPLEWLAYGPCAHRDVCSTCVVRLRNVCDDRLCCICKTYCDVVFITKAMGDYTRTVDFQSLQTDPREGQMGLYWYHEATQAFFDDIDQYRMIKAMCTFSCSLCDKEGQHNHGRRDSFRSLEQLKGHLFHRHRLFMCKLCLEGRKVFVCEQKLYSKAQLNQHISTGDSEVDGTKSERGGFMGHPMCEFCRIPFYGENELYKHTSTEHYTCHICQRQNPGQIEHYRNYDDMEMHFRRDHYLCEDEECLGKKFIVFLSENELKRHNVLEHGGRMSRSKRNAVLQIPTSFSYRLSDESAARRGIGRASRRQPSSHNQLSLAIQASLETAYAETRRPNPPSSSSIGQQTLDDEGTSLNDILIPSFESLAATDSDSSSRYQQSVSHNHEQSLGECSFPPLSATPGINQQNPQQGRNGLSENTMAARLRKSNNVKVVNVARAWPTANKGPAFPSTSSIQTRPVNNMAASLSGSSQSTIATARNPSTSFRVKQPTSARSFDPVSDFPSVSSAKSHRPGSSSQTMKTEDTQNANKSLVERIRASLDHDKDKYAAFKEISQEYRQGSVDTLNYLYYITQFGLMHLVPELARLCPEPHKQKELVEAYNSNLQCNGSWGDASIRVTEKKSNSKSSKGKKLLEADTVLETFRGLQSEVEVLEKNGRAVKGKSKVTINDRSEPDGSNLACSISNGDNAKPSGNGGSKRGKKTSKFHRVRLGESSAAAVLDLRNPSNDQAQKATDNIQDSSARSPVRNVWQTGGSKKLFGASKR